MLKPLSPPRALLVAAVVLAGLRPAWADSPDGFDRAATESQPASPSRNPSTSSQNDSPADDFWSDFFGQLFVNLGDISMARMQPAPDENSPVEPRATGEALLPIVRLDLNGQDLGSNTKGGDYTVQAGYGSLAAEARQTFFSQSDPHQSLTISEYEMLLRFSGDHRLGVSLGAGATVLDGLTHASGPNATLAIEIHPEGWLGAEARDTVSNVNGNTLYDHDGSLLLTHSYAALRLGFRYQHVHAETLKGPYVGFSLYY